jgi:hypothetical protein
MICVGLGLHKSFSLITAMNAQGKEMVKQKKIAHNGEKVIASTRIKNDKIDSRVLAHLLRTDLLPLSYVPEKAVRLQRELLRYRASLTRIQTGVKNRTHAMLAKNNITHDFSDLFGKQGKGFLHSLSLPEIYHQQNNFVPMLGLFLPPIHREYYFPWPNN